MCALSSSQVLVVVIAHHFVDQVSLVCVVSWSSHDERIFDLESSIPFHFLIFSFIFLTSCTQQTCVLRLKGDGLP